MPKKKTSHKSNPINRRTKGKNIFLPLLAILTPLITLSLVSWFVLGNIKPASAGGLCLINSNCAYNEECRSGLCQLSPACWHNWCDANGNWCHGGYHFANHKCVFDDVC